MTMTDPSVPSRKRLRADGSSSSHVKVHVYFLKESVRVVVKQPNFKQAPESNRKLYHSAQRQCCSRLMMDPPQAFDVDVSGSVSAPTITVTIEKSLMEKLPLLATIGNSTVDEDEDDLMPEESEENVKATQVELPCTVWALVSLLVLLEGNVSCQQWFQGTVSDSDASLPAQTVEAAEFMGCQELRSVIIEWLQVVLKEFVKWGRTIESVGVAADTLQSSCLRMCYYTKVLRGMRSMRGAAAVAKEVFSVLVADAGSFAAAAADAVQLPQDLFAEWVAAADPVVDLRDVHLTQVQWKGLADCFTQPALQLEAIQTLHLPALQFPDARSTGRIVVCETRELSEFEHIMMDWSKQTMSHTCSSGGRQAATLNQFAVGFSCGFVKNDKKAPPCGGFCAILHAPKYEMPGVASSSRSAAVQCRDTLLKLQRFCAHAPSSRAPCENSSCSNKPTRVPSEICPGFHCSGCGKFTLSSQRARALPCFEQNISIMGNNAEAVQGSSYDSVLGMMWGAVSCMPSLQHIALHGLQLSLHSVTLLGQLLTSLPPTVTKLTITTPDAAHAADAASGLSGAAETVLLFRAVAMVRSLRELYMPQWEDIVGQHGSDCVAVLKALPGLQAVHVAEVKESPAFPPGVAFRAIEEEV